MKSLHVNDGLRHVLGLIAASLLVAACGGEGSSEDGAEAPTTGTPNESVGGGDPTPAGESCPGGSIVKSEGLAFDGKTTEVTMGVAPTLGLAKFTVETWVRRDGVGQATSSGAGGITFVPIAGKGRGENDDTVKNCNYAFGFVNGRLAADFEDDVDGGNHPVVGATEVTIGEWHHAAATYDGAAWRLYLDGRLEAQRVANATPRADSIQHFGVGTTYNSLGAPAGHLHGAIAELRVWNHARSEADVRAGMHKRIDKGDGLVGRWSFDGANGLADSLGKVPAFAKGTTAPAAPGPALDLGAAPTVELANPPDRSDVPAAGEVELGVKVADGDSTAHVTTFHVREIGESEDFSVVVLPDTQYYTVQANGFERYFYDQTKWVMDNRTAYNIKAVIHNGDLVNNGDRFEYQWTVADRAMKTIEAKSAALPDGLPWGIGLGNHDRDDGAGGPDPGTTVRFNRSFGVARFQGRAYYGGHMGTTNDNNWFTFNAGGLDFVVVNYRYLNVAPSQAVTDWARQVFQLHPYAFGIANSHSILTGGGNFSAAGRGIYEGLKDVKNVQLLTCGHVSAEKRRTDTFEGHAITSMLADFQSLNIDTAQYRGGEGFLRIWEFSPASDELTVRTYSPTSKKFRTGADSEFTLKVDLSGVGGEFKPVAVVDASTTTPTAKLKDLKPGATYEWYATVSDCAHVVSTPRFRFIAKK